MATGRKIALVAQPEWLDIGGYWHACGGISIDVFLPVGEPVGRPWLPDHGVANYRGRG